MDCHINRWRRRVRLLLAGAAFLLAAAAASAGALAGRAASQGPHLELSPCALDLGRGRRGETLMGVLELINTGNTGLLTFQLRAANCGCTELNPRNGEVPPHASQRITVSLRLDDYSTSDREVELILETNDPAQPVIRCHVTARCPPPFVVVPKQLNFGRLFTEDVTKAVRILEIRDSAGKPLYDPHILHLVHVPRAVRIMKEQGRDYSVRLRAILPPGLERGQMVDNLQLRLDGAQETVSVPFHVEVIDPVSVVPSTAYLREDAATGKYAPVELIVVNRRPDRPIGSVSLSCASHAVEIIESSCPGTTGDSRHLRVTVPKLTGSDRRISIRLKFSNSDCTAPIELVVP